MLLGVCTANDATLRPRGRDNPLEREYLARTVEALAAKHADITCRVFAPDTAAEDGAVPLAPGMVLPFSRSYRPALARAAAAARVDVLVAPPAALSGGRTDYDRVAFLFDLLPWRRRPGPSGVVEYALPRHVAKVCQSAQGIVCPSREAQRVCAGLLGVGLERITVAPPGVAPLFSEPAPPMVSPPYCVTALNPYTAAHLPTVIETAKKRPELFPPTLVVTGPPMPDEPADWGMPVIRVESCPPRARAALLQHAEFFLYPALGDLSGMPVLEALRAGTPVVTARAGALPEVSGSVPFFCDPESGASIVQTLRRLAEETPRERRERVATGRMVAQDHEWGRCAWKLLSAAKRAG
ncbi:MAG TPA: glycosyltransferase [Candidatus Hydrogenedentes bacterium]|nr:glycosyltransferase [Candidatus Hydrogenedentota bacterium]